MEAARGSQRHAEWIDTLAIARPVKIVQGTGDMVMISVPEIVRDEAMFEYLTQRERVDVSLSRNGRTWTVVKEERSAAESIPFPASSPVRDFDRPLRVGGDVKAPVIVKRVEAVSTKLAKRAHISGVVIIEVVIDRDGHLADMHILKALPMGLDAAAEQAVRQWEFRPGTLSGQPVPVIFNVTVTFKND